MIIIEIVFALYGGASILTSARDYLTFLRHLLQIHSNTLPTGVEPIVTREMLVFKVFRPALSKRSQESIETMLGPVVGFMGGGGIQWGYGGMALTMGDWAVGLPADGTKMGLRKAGSAFCKPVLVPFEAMQTHRLSNSRVRISEHHALY